MLLIDIFTGIFAQNITSLFQCEFIKQSDIIEARKKEVATYRILEDHSQVALYRYFLDYCEGALKGLNEQSLLEILIDFLASDDIPLDERSVCNKLRDIFHLNLQHQEDVSTIASMGHTLIDRPKAFTAFVYYLIYRGMSPEQILSTHLLQNYFRYYLHTLKYENNAITQLYRILNTYSEAQALCNLAQKIRCEEGGPIDGTAVINVDSLVKIELQSLPISYTATINNFRGLHAIFGIHFLFNGLAQKNNSLCIEFLNNICNQTYVVNTQLPKLLNVLQEHPAMQERIAALLCDETLASLVQKRIISLLSLIPFRPNIINIIPMPELRAYLQDIRKQCLPEVTLISNLFILFNAIKSINEKAAELVFDAILDAAMNAPSYVFDDSLLIKNFGGCSLDTLIQKINTLEAEIDEIIAYQTRNSIEEMDYISIEDTWKSVAQKIKNLQEITDVTTTCPCDKYQLYSRIARNFLAQNNTLDLSTFIRQLGIEPHFEEARVNEYERCLVELLCDIDNAGLRDQCIQLLDGYARHSWQSFVYGNQNIFIRAASAGNLGLIQRLKKDRIFFPLTDYNKLAIDAAKANYWPLVAYFHQHHNLNKNIIKRLLKLAIKQLPSDCNTFLSCKHQLEEMLILIEAEFISAIKENNYNTVNWLLSCSTPPHDKCKAAALVLAEKNNYLDIVQLLMTGDKPQKFLKKAIEKVFMKAIEEKKGDDLLHFLTRYSNLELNESRLFAAQQANKLDIVKLLTQLPFHAPSIKILEEVYNNAQKKRQYSIANYLRGVCEEMKKAPQKLQSDRLNEENVLPSLKQSTSNISGLNKHTLFGLSNYVIANKNTKRSCGELNSENVIQIDDHPLMI